MIRITMISDSDNSCSNCYLNNMCKKIKRNISCPFLRKV